MGRTSKNPPVGPKGDARHDAPDILTDTSPVFRLAGAISEEMWARRSAEWESEINQVRGDMARLEDASRNYTVTGLTDPRTRKKRVFTVQFARSRGSGEIAQNGAIELHLRSRKSLSYLQ